MKLNGNWAALKPFWNSDYHLKNCWAAPNMKVSFYGGPFKCIVIENYVYKTI